MCIRDSSSGYLVIKLRESPDTCPDLLWLDQTRLYGQLAQPQSECIPEAGSLKMCIRDRTSTLLEAGLVTVLAYVFAQAGKSFLSQDRLELQGEQALALSLIHI